MSTKIKQMTKFRYDMLYLIASHDENGETGIPAFLVHRFKPSSKRAANWLIVNGFAKFELGKLVATDIGFDETGIEK